MCSTHTLHRWKRPSVSGAQVLTQLAVRMLAVGLHVLTVGLCMGLCVLAVGLCVLAVGLGLAV